MLGRPTPMLRSFDEKRSNVDLCFRGFEVLFEARFDRSAPLYVGLKKDQCVLYPDPSSNRLTFYAEVRP
jgi:hypothetical protein